MSSWLILGLAVLALAGAFAYRLVWRAVRQDGAVPTGYGALIAGFFVFAAVFAHVPQPFLWATLLIAVVSAVYWLDDVIELPVGLRIALQFGTGAGIGYILLCSTLFAHPIALIAVCAAAGCFNAAAANVINFYDGADLNLATLMVLTAISVLVGGAVSPALSAMATAVVAFVVPFAAVNSRPKSLYFGDAGSFAFASIVTACAILSLRDGDARAAYAAIPLAFPVIDAVYVISLRLKRGEDLLSRTYLYLYQQMQAKYRNFTYLAPQAVAILLGSAAAFVLTATGLAPFAAVCITISTVTPLLYLVCRRSLVG